MADRHNLNEDGVSEVMGSVLLIALVVIAVAIVAVTLFSQPHVAEVPHASIVAGNSSNGSFVLFHEGGDPLTEGKYRVYVDTGTGLEDQTDAFALAGDGLWSIGEALTYTGPGTPERVVVSGVDSGGGETVIAEPTYQTAAADTGGYVDAGGSGRVPVTPGGGNEPPPVFIVLPELGTDIDFISGGGGGGPPGHYYSEVTANVTDPEITQVDFVMYNYERSPEVLEVLHDVSWDPATQEYHAEFGFSYGEIKKVDTAVVVAIAFNDTTVVGCEARKINITVTK